MRLRYEFMELARELEAEDNAACDLWTWLPSYRAAKERHGDYTDEVRPSNADLMIEASRMIATQRGYENDISDHQIWEWFGCPCGECDMPPPEELQRMLAEIGHTLPIVVEKETDTPDPEPFI